MSQEWVHYAQAITTVITSQNDGLGSQGGLIIFFIKRIPEVLNAHLIIAAHTQLHSVISDIVNFSSKAGCEHKIIGVALYNYDEVIISMKSLLM